MVQALLPGIVGKAEQVVFAVGKFLNFIAVAAIAVSGVMTGIDVVMRYFFSSPLPGVYDLSQFLLVAMVALPLAYCQQSKAHIRVDVLIGRLTGKGRAVMELATAVLALILFGLATVTGVEVAWRAYVTGDYVLGIINYPLWPVKSILALGIGIFCLQLAFDVMHHALDSFRTAGRA